MLPSRGESIKAERKALVEELKSLRQQGYKLQVDLRSSFLELECELDRIEELIEQENKVDECPGESELIEDEIDNEDMYDETDDEIENNDELELVETIDYKGNEIVIYYQVNKGYTFEVNNSEIYQTPLLTHEKALIAARRYADKYIICDDNNEMNYTYTPMTKIEKLTYRNQPIQIDGFENKYDALNATKLEIDIFLDAEPQVDKKLEMMKRIAKETFLNLNLNRET
jgi:hypothetical protein